jgi:hydrogenase expression/formation protein HypD
MSYLKDKIKILLPLLEKSAKGLGKICLMEVCGTHTVAVARFGLKKFLPDNVVLLSGPGCPVCVTAEETIDQIIALSKKEEVTIVTFGDMLKVAGSRSSLERMRAEGRDIRLAYSPLDALALALKNPRKEVIFLAVGFETTAPTVGATILEAKKLKLKNFFVFSAHKLIPPAMQLLLKDPSVQIDGFLCPGHVSAIIGTKAYEPIVKNYRVACVISGFEALDIMQSIYLLLQMIRSKQPAVANEYKRVVKRDGNPQAQKILSTVFYKTDSLWRGLGQIPQSGLKISPDFASFDAEKKYGLKTSKVLPKREKNCLCAEVLKGKLAPCQCPFFAKKCRPEHPVGACMVSGEGACAVYFRYGRGKKAERK